MNLSNNFIFEFPLMNKIIKDYLINKKYDNVMNELKYNFTEILQEYNYYYKDQIYEVSPLLYFYYQNNLFFDPSMFEKYKKYRNKYNIKRYYNKMSLIIPL